jgi:hypothetical protein
VLKEIVDCTNKSKLAVCTKYWCEYWDQIGTK